MTIGFFLGMVTAIVVADGINAFITGVVEIYLKKNKALLREVADRIEDDDKTK